MKQIFAVLFLLLLNGIFAQKKLPVINATSVHVAINDGGILDKDAWSLSPAARPDVYLADRSQKEKWVTFYTDTDSIRIKVKPGSSTDFVILLNGKDSCFTQIRSSCGKFPTVSVSNKRHDTIPFILTKHNAIHVKAVVNNADTLNLHFDLGSLDFRLTKETLAKRKNAFSGQIKNPSSENIRQLQIGSMSWSNPEIKTAINASKEMDGRFGWNVFDGKVVEIDYNKKQMIVHSTLPAVKKGFIKSDIHFIKSLLCIEAVIVTEDKKYKGNFLLDTGSDLSVILDSVWMHENGFPKDLNVLKKTVFSDGAGRKYESKQVSLSGVLLNGKLLKQVPASLLGYESPVGYQINYFGNELLKRYNVILDLRKDKIYLKPNNLFNQPFQTTG